MKLAAGARLLSQFIEGAELLVLEESLNEAGHEYGEGSLLRLPPGEYPQIVAGPKGVSFYLKTGHFGKYLTGVSP